MAAAVMTMVTLFVEVAALQAFVLQPRAAFRVVGTMKIWRPLSVTTNLGYGNFFVVFMTTNNYSKCHVTSKKAPHS
jgi:hypothetical protein